jgi:hypothetical protein
LKGAKFLILNFFSHFYERWLQKLQKGIPLFSKKHFMGIKKQDLMMISKL